MMMWQSNRAVRQIAAMVALGGVLGLMAGCDDPPQTTSSSYEQTTTTTTSPPPMAPVAAAPGTVTTQTTHTQTLP
jgi:multidrug efflux pump subunit AcrA (membrane-fusion protein)